MCHPYFSSNYVIIILHIICADVFLYAKISQLDFTRRSSIDKFAAVKRKTTERPSNYYHYFTEKNKKITIKESDILIDEQEEQEKREFNNKRQATDLPVLFDWHLSLWRTRIIPYTYSSSYFTSKLF